MITQNGTYKGYNVENGFIQSPGRFEGEPVYAIDAYEYVLDGDSEFLGKIKADLIQLSDEDRTNWGLGADAHSIILEYSEQGFIYSDLLNETQREKTIKLSQLDEEKR